MIIMNYVLMKGGLGVRILFFEKHYKTDNLFEPVCFFTHRCKISSRSTFEFPSRSTFPVTVCTVSPGHWVNKADTQ